MTLLPPPPRKYKGILIGCSLFLVCYLGVIICGDHGLIHLLRVRAEQHNLEQQAFQLQQRNEQLRTRLRRLQSDDAYIERLARERLGLVKPGEIVFRVRPPGRTAAARKVAGADEAGR